MAVIDAQVSASGDDGVAKQKTTQWVGTDTNPFIGRLDGTDIYHFSARFTGISGLAGATVTAAWVSLWTDTTFGTGGADMTVFAEDAEAPAQISGATAGDKYTDWNGRVRTAAGVVWNNIPSAGGAFTDSPSLVSVIQELIDNGYDPSAIHILIDETGSGIVAERTRIHTFDFAAADAPKLHIEFTEAAGGDPEGGLVGGKLIRGGILGRGRLVG